MERVGIGITLINLRTVQELCGTEDKYSDFGRDIFPGIVSRGVHIYGYNTHEYIKDIGTVERLQEVEKDYFSGRVQNLNKSKKQKAIFIDRDGVINEEADPLNSIDKFKLFQLF